MTINEIDNIHKLVSRCIDDAEINDAFTHLATLINESGRVNLNDELERLHMSYTFMLKYLEQGVMDPQRDIILSDIRRSLYTLNDRCFIALMEPVSSEVFYTRRRELGNLSLVAIVEEYRDSLKELSLAQSAPAEQSDNHVILSLLQHAEALETKLFNRVWSTFPLSADDSSSLKLCISGDILPVHTRCLLVAALMLGLMKFYDESKLLILFEAYSLSDDAQVQLRALVCAMLAMLAHRKRTSSSKPIQARIAAMLDMPDFEQDVWSIQVQLAQSRNTENVKQKVRNELIPNIMKMRPDIIDKLKDNESQIIDLSDIEANPEWQQWLDESGITRRIEEFNAMQTEGSDVFIATFAHLKTFPFFKTLSNWFLPFYPAHSTVLENLGAGKLGLAEVIQHAPYLCNSDKYSFCLSLGSLPESQRGLMSAQLEEQNAALKEAQQAELPDDRKLRVAIVNAFIQDLYRFFKLFSRHREFNAVMDSPGLDMTDCMPLAQVTRDAHVLELLGALYFKNAFYDDAIKCFTRLEGMDNVSDDHIYQKIGFAYQNAGKIENALTYYQRYELLHENDLWNVRHMAACYRELGKLDLALEYYRRAEALSPDNVSLTLTIGHVLLEQNRTNDALQQYFKADLMEGARHRAWRPIAWCSFLLSDYERALDYYNRIANEDEPSAQDLLNMGHVLLCQGKTQEAIETYRSSLHLMDGDTAKFRKSLKGDALELRLHGISAVDQALIPDIVCSSKTDNNK
ncbi:MAG: tetratricopeptide repeat protein [Muribaculaceae bacterium]|nr:tetratricopeptide repeat protein [Muribaculaceae bacterium]